MVARTIRISVIVAVVVGAGCDPCGPPAEPLITVRVDIDGVVQPGPDDYLHLQMLNGADQLVTGYDRPVSSIDRFPFEHLLGNCDGYPQQSGTFTIRAWLDTQGPGADVPTPGAPIGLDRVQVACDVAGCVAARDVAILIAPPQAATDDRPVAPTMHGPRT